MTNPGASAQPAADRDGLTRADLLKAAGRLVVAVPAASLIAACGGQATGSGSGSAASTSQATLRIGEDSEVDSLNPFVSQANVPYEIFGVIFPLLVNQLGPSAPIVGDFASSWKVSNDHRTYTFRTRLGGHWTDGRPLTAADAAFTLNMIIEHRAGPTALQAPYVTGMDHAEAPDDATLVVHYSQPTAPALANLAFPPILPQHIWAPLAKGSGARILTFNVNQTVVSCGPYRLSQYTQNQVATVERYAGTYPTGRRAKPERIGWMYLSSDAALTQAIASNTVDALDAGLDIPAGLRDLSRSVDVAYAPGSQWWSLGFNTSQQKLKNRELLDPAVRTALAHATNKDAIVSDVLFGHGQPGSSIVAPAMGAWNDPSLKPETFDTDLANHMLDQLGYRRGRGGIRVADGHRMSYVMNVSTDITPYDRVFEIVADGWSQCGVQLTQRPLDTAAMVNAVIGTHGYRTNDVYIWYWGGATDPQFILTVLTTAQLGGFSDTGFSDKRYDALFKSQLHEMDKARRRSLVFEMQQLIYRLKPYVVLCYPNAYRALSRRWSGLPLTPVGTFTQQSKEWVYDATEA